jgi:AcrR family transcriptional regulator
MRSADKAPLARRTRLTAGQRRESILDAATEVFAAAGYRAAKVSDVAARIGVTEPVIFQNFGSKAALYTAVLDRLVGHVRAELQQLTEQHGSAPQLLAHVLSPPAPGSTSHGHRSHHALFANAATLAADPDPDLLEPARRAARALAAHLADVLRSGQAEGSLRPEADPEAAAWLLLSVLSARPVRTVAMPHRDRLEPKVTELALQALVLPAAAPVPAGPKEGNGAQRQ